MVTTFSTTEQHPHPVNQMLVRKGSIFLSTSMIMCILGWGWVGGQCSICKVTNSQRIYQTVASKSKSLKRCKMSHFVLGGPVTAPGPMRIVGFQSPGLHCPFPQAGVTDVTGNDTATKQPGEARAGSEAEKLRKLSGLEAKRINT